MEDATRPDPIADFARVIAAYRNALKQAGIIQEGLVIELVLDFQRALLARGIGTEFKKGRDTDVRELADRAVREAMLTRTNHWR